MQLKAKDISVPTSLVLDLGTAQVKHGWSTTGGQPTAVFPTVVGRGRHKGAMQKLGLRDSYVGRKAQARRGILSLSNPIRNGVVENWDDLELIWEHIWETEGRNADNGNSGTLFSHVAKITTLSLHNDSLYDLCTV